jgi:predicted DNA-binding protein
MPTTKNVVYALGLPAELKASLEKLSVKNGRTLAGEIRYILTQAVNEKS